MPQPEVALLLQVGQRAGAEEELKERVKKQVFTVLASSASSHQKFLAVTRYTVMSHNKAVVFYWLTSKITGKKRFTRLLVKFFFDVTKLSLILKKFVVFYRVFHG